MKDKIQKLLNQATDTEGTPESEVFYQKAFELMARYGLTERDLNQPHEPASSHNEELSGTYTDMKALLLSNLASTLHCVSLSYVRPRSTRVLNVRIFGLPRHIERVVMLYRMLWPTMVAHSLNMPGKRGVSTVVIRRSYMRGFIAGIVSRLREAENTVAEGSYALVLIDDSYHAQQAMQRYMKQENLESTTRTHGQSEANAFGCGVSDSARADLGQTRVMGLRELNS